MLRHQKQKRVSARATAVAFVVGAIGMIVTALPASATTISSFTPACGVATNTVTIVGSGFNSSGDATAGWVRTTLVIFLSPGKRAPKNINRLQQDLNKLRHHTIKALSKQRLFFHFVGISRRSTTEIKKILGNCRGIKST